MIISKPFFFENESMTSMAIVGRHNIYSYARPNSLPIETPPHIISLGAGEAFGRRRRAICTTARSSPSSASFFVVLSLCSVVSVVSNNAVSSSFSVTTAPVLSSTYLQAPPPPPLLTVMKSSHLSTLPETISNHGRSPLLTLSVLPFHPGIVKPRTCGSMLSMKNLQLDPTYAEPLEPDLLVNLVLGFTSPSPVRRLCQSTPLSRLSPSPDRVTNSSHRLHPTPASFLTCLYATDYTPNIEAAPSHQGFYGAKLHRLDLRLLVTTGPIVQECCFARFHGFHHSSLSHYAVSSIDGSSQNRICGLPDLLVAGTIVQECGLARFTNSITAAIPSHYAVSSIDGSSQLCDFHTGVVTRRPIHPEAFYLLSDVCSHTLWLNESDDCLLRSSVTTCWARHGNVEFRVLDPIKPSALSSNLISPSASLEVKLELEIHLVYSMSF
ncbi:hypothetical protein Bca52824_044781 [Brassica carinata]|uniref:Uncharacterized protein n=1 Tax=Brassica carinata TaxID=52824 RepID=A0A8X7RCI8_BRACI|nr:hypothetical protein Bca52824_044781 [Brassica carinata]